MDFVTVSKGTYRRIRWRVDQSGGCFRPFVGRARGPDLVDLSEAEAWAVKRARVRAQEVWLSKVEKRAKVEDGHALLREAVDLDLPKSRLYALSLMLTGEPFSEANGGA